MRFYKYVVAWENPSHGENLTFKFLFFHKLEIILCIAFWLTEIALIYKGFPRLYDIKENNTSLQVFVLISWRQDAVVMNNQGINKLPNSVTHIQHLQKPAADWTH